MWVEAFAAGVVGMALLWLVLQPLLLPSPYATISFDTPDPEETPRGQALLALHEIDFDRATGKLSDADYTELHARYSAKAIALLDHAPATEVDPLEAMIAAHSVATAPLPERGRRCLVHGPRLESDATFCAACGAGLIDSNGCCAGCRSVVPQGASFCPGCGAKVRA